MVGAVGQDPSISANAFLSAFGRGAPTGGPSRTAKVPEGETGRAVEGVQGKAELSEEDLIEIEDLKQRDDEVRRHEQAHKAAAGQYAKGAPKYDYVRGPDGQRYAEGGEVRIDTSPVADDPEATIRKMQQVQQAAQAPKDPSSTDRQVAADAAKAEAEARAELAEQRTGEVEPTVGQEGGAAPTGPEAEARAELAEQHAGNFEPAIGQENGAAPTGPEASQGSRAEASPADQTPKKASVPSAAAKPDASPSIVDQAAASPAGQAYAATSQSRLSSGNFIDAWV